jgi:hypothetical protein
MAGEGHLLTKAERLALVFASLRAESPAADHDEAMTMIAATLCAVEDEFSGIPYNPEEPGTDGRMYPPTERFRYLKWERPGARCYRQTAHATFVADNGAVEVRSRKAGELGPVLFEKEGKDGRKVSSYDPAQ